MGICLGLCLCNVYTFTQPYITYFLSVSVSVSATVSVTEP